MSQRQVLNRECCQGAGACAVLDALNRLHFAIGFWKNSGTVPEFFQSDVCGKRKRCAGDNSQIETLIAHYSST
jgi:hypothetical protein